MKIRRTHARWLVIGLLVLLVYGGASWVQLDRILAETRDDDRIVLRFAHWQLEAGMREAFENAAQRYMALHPGVRVEPMAIPGNVYTQWLNTQLIGETAPDIVMFDSRFSAEVQQMTRFFEPLSRWLVQPNPYNRGTPLENVPWRLTFLDGLRNRATYNEQLRDYFAVSLCSHAMLMFYNRDLMTRITGSPEPPATFTDWLALGEKIRADHPDLVHVAGAKDYSVWLMALLANQSVTRWLLQADHGLRYAVNGTDLYTDLLDGRWDVDTPALQTALHVIHAVGRQMTPGFLQLDKSTALESFVRGEAVSLFSGTWDYPSLEALADFEVGGFMVPVPTATESPYGGHALLPAVSGTLSTAMPFFVNRQSAHQAVAIDFLHYLTSMEGNARFAREGRLMPAILGVETGPALRRFKPQYEGHVVTTTNDGLSLMYGTGPEYTRLWLSHLHQLFAPNGGIEPYGRTLRDSLHAAVVADLGIQLKNRFVNLRQRDVVLAALSHLNENDRQEARHQYSAQHLMEFHTYRLQLRLNEPAQR